MNRIVQAELLDELPPEDPGAIQSRRDLIRLNAWMGNAQTIARALRQTASPRPPERIVELGAGDGDFLLQIARRYQGPNPARPLQAILVDQQNLLHPQTQRRLEQLHWQTRVVQADVFDFLQNQGPSSDVLISNLFLHHFSDANLRRLFLLASRRTQTFIAVEPHRSALAHLFSRLIWVIGCNAVTRHDAVVSVEAGFTGRELSTLWPDPQQWELTEQRAGFFSHLFVARRKSRP